MCWPFPLETICVNCEVAVAHHPKRRLEPV